MTAPGEAAPARAPIDDGFFADIRGEPQWITLRGADAGATPLLMLTGAGAAFSRMAPFFAPWETALTLVQWDQPGAGATLARNGETSLSLDRLAADAAAVAETALARLGAEKLVVLGISGGSVIGLKLAKARPDLVAAFVGTGQIVHWARQQSDGYALALAAARTRGDAAAVAALEGVGPPPYPDLAAQMVFSQHANGLTPAEQAEFAALDPAVTAALAAPPAGARYAPPDLALGDPRAAAMRAWLALEPEIAAFDARSLGTRFDVPMIFLQGVLDHYTPTAEVFDYAAELSAPRVSADEIAGGGHSVVFLRDPFLRLLQLHIHRMSV
ncbi:MAG TPA: alpha/beta hydrolase [Caulobacteraceae bacterium]|nr:alpha/beta hydrolase [Caulobacteraceae bacterium]